MREEMLMLRKWNRFIAFILAFALIATTFNSDLASVRVFADDAPEETVEQPAEEAPQQESGGEEAQPENNGGEDYQEEGGGENYQPENGGEETAPPAEEPVQDPDQQPAPEESTQNPPAVEPATPDAASTDVVIPEEPKEEAATESSFDKEKEDAASESSSKEDAAAEASSEDDATTEASSEDKEEKENFITIKYVATEGGSVSNAEEKINLDDSEAKIEGSTAKSFEGFEFVSWEDADGNSVSESETFIPSGLDEDAEFTAKFKAVEKKIEMPAQRFNGYAGGVAVYVDAQEGAFPEGTVMEVAEVSDQEVLDKAADAVEGTAVEVKAVDITFKYNGAEVQPEVPITVKLTTTAIENADNTEVVHIDNSGNADVINSDVNGITAEITAESFSIYAVVNVGSDARLKVIFNNGTTPAPSMYVKEGDNMEVVLYDPGVGELEDGVIFKGWTTEENYTLETTPLSIDDIRNEMDDLLPPEYDEFERNYYPIFTKLYLVTYVDETGASIGQEQIEVLANATGEDLKREYKVNMGYTADGEHDFQGWLVNEGGDHIVAKAGQPYEYIQGDIFQNDDDITIDGNVIFKVNAPLGHWLVFNENGKGGKYNAPQFVKTGDVTHEPCDPADMTRYGYTFAGWFEAAEAEPTEAPDEENGESETPAASSTIQLKDTPFEFGNTLEVNTTIYAKWTPNEKAPYTVILWTENISRSGYDLKEAFVENEGTVGENIPYEIYTDNGDENYALIGNNKDVEKHYKGFSAKEPEQQVEITPEGDAVLNIYFDRIEYNLRFYLYRDNGNRVNQYSFGNNSASGANIWGVVNWHDNQSSHPTTDYTLEHSNVEGYEAYYFVIHGYYGENILEQWPQYDKIHGVGNNQPVSFVMMNGTKLKPNPTSTGSGTVKGNISILDENILGATNDSDGNFLIVRFNNYNDWRYHIWFPVVEGEDIGDKPTREYNGVLYYKAEIVTPRSSNTDVNQQNAPQYTGYEYSFRRNEDWNGDGRWTVGNTYNINYVYKRLAYKVNFMDGKYVDGNGNQLNDRSKVLLAESEDVPFGAIIPDNIQNYKPTLPDGEKGYVFEGWYADATCNTLYDFSGTMPVGGIEVYAKWRQVQYRVFLHPNAYNENGTKDESLDWGDDPNDPEHRQQMNFRVSYGQKVSTPTGTRDGYVFVGWYFDEACTRVFNGNSYVLNETIGLQEYNKTAHMTDPMDKWGAGATTNADVDRFWITEEFNIYGKWRKILTGANGINITYSLKDPDVETEGTGTAADSNQYVDNAYAIAVPAVNAPDGYVFDHWVMQKWVATGEYVDTEEAAIYPGQEYKVLAKYAKVEIEDMDGDGNIIEAKYTIQLRADYKEKEKATPTFIPWFKNDGSEAFHIDTTAEEYSSSTLGINEGVEMQPAPTRKGYKFIGWTRVNIGEEESEVNDFMKYSSNWEKTDLTAEYFYSEDNRKYYPNSDFTGNEVAMVAADEDMPYQAMFAVWEKTDMVLTAEGIEHEYDGNFYSITATVDVTEGTTIYYSIDQENWSETNPGYKDVGEYLVYVKAVNDQYDDATASAIVKITPKKVTVKADNASKEYGKSDPQPFSATVTGLVGEDTIEYSVAREGNDEEVGTYEDVLVASGEEEQGNYIVEYLPGDFTITRAGGNEISAESYSGIYDAEYHSIIVSGGAEGTTYKYRQSENEEWSETLPQFINVTNGATVYVKGENKNYEDCYAQATVTISPRPVIVQANNASKVFGEADPEEFTARIVEPTENSGVVDDYEIVWDRVYRPGAGTDEAVGVYVDAIVIEGSKDQGNYEVTYKPGTFSITESQALSVTATGYDGIYDGQGHTIEATASVQEGTKIYYSIDHIEWKDSLDEFTYKNVTPDAIEIYVKAENPNYQTATAAATVMIRPREIKVKADNSEKIYGNPDPSYTAAIVDGEVIDGYELKYDVTRPGAGTDEDVDVYEGAIVVSGEATQGNYKVSYETGDFEIKARAITITAGSSEDHEFDGKEVVVEDYSITEGELAEGDTYTAELKDNKRTVVGEQQVTIVEESVVIKKGEKDVTDNYEITLKPGTLKILDRAEKYEITISNEEIRITYDGQEHKYISEYSVEEPEEDASILKWFWDKVSRLFTLKVGAAEGIKFTIDDVEYVINNVTIESERGKNVGDYNFSHVGDPQIWLGDENVTSQFTINYDLKKLIIEPAPVTVTAVDGLSKQVNEQDPEFTAELVAENEALQAEAEENVRFEVGREAGEVAGEYAVNATGEELQGNFKVKYVPGKFTITAITPPDDPTPDPTPTPTPTPIPDDPTPTAPTPAPVPAPVAIAPAGEAVLGARRDSGQAVLGARRARTEDSTNLPARLLVILAAAAASATFLLIGKRKEEEED